MKTTRASKATLVKAWNGIWTSYTAAVRSGDQEQLSAAKAQARSWHEQMGASIPSWAW
jgi:hypothetical protein